MLLTDWLAGVVENVYGVKGISIRIRVINDEDIYPIWQRICNGESLCIFDPPMYIEFVLGTSLRPSVAMQNIAKVKDVLFGSIYDPNDGRSFATGIVFEKKFPHMLYFGRYPRAVQHTSYLSFTMHDDDTASQVLEKNIVCALYAMRCSGVSRDVCKIIASYCFAPPRIPQWSISYVSAAVGGALKRQKQ